LARCSIFLLIELYREKEEFISSKRNHKIWEEIAASMKETNFAYNVTEQHCSVKMAGLKRTYKNIKDKIIRVVFKDFMDIFFGEFSSLVVILLIL